MANTVRRRLGREGGAQFTQVTNATAEITMAQLVLRPGNIDKRHIIRVRAVCRLPETNSTDTFAFRLRLGTTVLSQVTAFDATNNDICTVTFEGAIDPYDAEIHGFGLSARTGQAPVYLGTADLAFNPAVAQTISVTGQWSVANTGNIADLKVFNIELLPEDAA